MYAVAIEAEFLGDLDLAAHIGIGRISVVALGIVALVEGELQVEGTSVEGDVGIVGTWEGVDADGTLTEVGMDEVDGRTFTLDGYFDFVKIGVVEVPQVLVVEWKMETEDCVAALNARRGESIVGLFAIGEVETDGFARG